MKLTHTGIAVRIRGMRATVNGLINSLDLEADPDLVPIADSLEDIRTRILDLQATIHSLDHQEAFMEGVAAAVGLGNEA